jgi:glycerophosphoryl diester phosphodiesterase
MKIIGHRGARGLASENTLASLQKALEIGVDEIEVDVRVSRDGIPVLAHDSFITGDTVPLRISHHTHTELQKRHPDLATLDEAMRLIHGRADLQIEVKHREPVDPIVKVIREHITDKRPTLILLGSKSQKTLRALHRELPDIPKIVIEPWSGVRASWRAQQIGTRRISMRSWWLWRGFLRLMHKRGYQMVPYTVNNTRTAAKWQKYLYGIVTDYPDRFRDDSGSRL